MYHHRALKTHEMFFRRTSFSRRSSPSARPAASAAAAAAARSEASCALSFASSASSCGCRGGWGRVMGFDARRQTTPDTLQPCRQPAPVRGTPSGAGGASVTAGVLSAGDARLLDAAGRGVAQREVSVEILLVFVSHAQGRGGAPRALSAGRRLYAAGRFRHAAAGGSRARLRDAGLGITPAARDAGENAKQQRRQTSIYWTQSCTERLAERRKKRARNLLCLTREA